MIPLLLAALKPASLVLVSGHADTFNINTSANVTTLAGGNFGDTFNSSAGSVTTVTGGTGANVLNYTGGTIGTINMGGSTQINSTTVVTTGTQTYSTTKINNASGVTLNHQ